MKEVGKAMKSVGFLCKFQFVFTTFKSANYIQILYKTTDEL